MKHMNEYIHCGYSGHRREAIFLTGIPDIQQSLPHASAYRQFIGDVEICLVSSNPERQGSRFR